MIKAETHGPTHRVYAVKNIGGYKSHWTEIGAARANREGKGCGARLQEGAAPIQYR